jgi:hypothetical protein
MQPLGASTGDLLHVNSHRSIASAECCTPVELTRSKLLSGTPVLAHPALSAYGRLLVLSARTRLTLKSSKGSIPGVEPASVKALFLSPFAPFVGIRGIEVGARRNLLAMLPNGLVARTSD